MNKSYHFIKLARGLDYPIYCNKTCVIPAGTKNVRIAFRQSHLLRWDESTHKHVKMNVYLWKGHMYHA